jgi:uncharacterized protein YbbC (DUF1343 family)
MKLLQLILLTMSMMLLNCAAQHTEPKIVKTGLDNLEKHIALLKGKRVGIITNHTAYRSDGQHIFDVLHNFPDVRVTALFGPEHGIRGKAEAGEHVSSDTDPILKIPVYSLYGATKKPTPEMLQDVDVLIFDMQDVGSRYYTYIYTMAYAMEAAAENGKTFVVLDRPNPITGKYVEGNVLDTAFASFVGRFPIAVRHGMTIGELAKMFDGEGWTGTPLGERLVIVTMTGWQRNMWYDQTGLPFIKPSPNMPSVMAEIAYPGTCLLEGTNVAEGRGTDMPFLLLGAPWIQKDSLTAHLNRLNLPGVNFIDTTFTPVAIPGASTNPKYRDEICHGVFINITNREVYQSFVTGLHIISVLHQLYPNHLTFRESFFDKLCGTDQIRKALVANIAVEQIEKTWQAALTQFNEIRKKYLLYH